MWSSCPRTTEQVSQVVKTSRRRQHIPVVTPRHAAPALAGGFGLLSARGVITFP